MASMLPKPEVKLFLILLEDYFWNTFIMPSETPLPTSFFGFTSYLTDSSFQGCPCWSLSSLNSSSRISHTSNCLLNLSTCMFNRHHKLKSKSDSYCYHLTGSLQNLAHFSKRQLHSSRCWESILASSFHFLFLSPSLLTAANLLDNSSTLVYLKPPNLLPSLAPDTVNSISCPDNYSNASASSLHSHPPKEWPFVKHKFDYYIINLFKIL